MNWRLAFRKQAESDLELYRTLKRIKAPRAHQVHYLQMATEKLIKSFSRQSPPDTVHRGIVKFLRISKRNRKLAESMGYNKVDVYMSVIDSILPLAARIEALAPNIARLANPNPEYPWQDAGGNVIVPVDFGFSEIVDDYHILGKYLKFMDQLLHVNVGDYLISL